MTTHIPKTIEVNGKKKTVFVRSKETQEEMEKFRLGPFVETPPLHLVDLNKVLDTKALIIQAPYHTARRAIRTRLDKDKTSHRVMSGSTILRDYFFYSESLRSGLPQFKQLFVLFGYIEMTNRSLNQILCESLYTRSECGLHFWLLIPKTLEEMAVQWGEAFLNFRNFPFLYINNPEDNLGPVSTASIATPKPSGKSNQLVKDPSYPEKEDELGPQAILNADPKFTSGNKKPKFKGWS